MILIQACVICHYWYFKDIAFKYQPYVCNGCHDFSMIVQKLDNFVILKVKCVDYRCCVIFSQCPKAVFWKNCAFPLQLMNHGISNVG